MKTCIAILLLAVASGSLLASHIEDSTSGRWTSEMDGWYLEKKTDWKLAGAKGASFTPDGRQAVIALTNSLAFVDLRDQRIRHVLDFSLLRGHEDTSPQAVAVSPLGIVAVAFPDQHEVILIDRVRLRISERIKTAFPPRQVRFSPQGKYLFIGNSPSKHTWPAIYSVSRRHYLLSRVEPMIVDISRDDRYLYLYDASKNSIRWLVSDTLETVRYFPLTPVSRAGRPLSLRILRDHRIAIGYRGSLVLTDRYLQHSEMVHTADDIEVSLLEPSHDNRFLVFGSSGRLRVLSFANNTSEELALPERIRELGTYPNGNYLLYLDSERGNAGILPIRLPLHHTRSDPSAIMVRN